MKLKLQTPMKKEEETKVAHNSSTYSEYTKTQFKYYIIGIYIFVEYTKEALHFQYIIFKFNYQNISYCSF